MLTTLAVANYRSLRSLILPLQGLNVVTGANGSGKSSVYRALRLLADSARDAGMVPALAREGGFASTLWAGPEEISRAMRRGEQPVQGTRRKEPVNLKLGFAGDEFGYSVELGLPPPPVGAFAGDPHIKRECVWHGIAFRPAARLVDRHNAAVQAKGEGKEWNVLTTQLSPYESMLSRLADPKRAPELLLLREQIRSWRFYDHFRTDAEAPARQPQIGTYTPVMANDGADLAAALQTIFEIGDRQALARAVDDAFPGASVRVEMRGGRFEVAMQQHGLLRALSAAELSDGTLRYLLWVAALLTPRPPALLVLNEPETSLHPDLLPALGRLIAHAAKNTQVLVVSHAARLIATLEGEQECNSLQLEKELGETRLAGVGQFDHPVWHWPAR